MIDYPRILFPLDLSHTAPVVAEHVVTMADKFDSEVYVIYVIPSYDGPTFPSYGQAMDEIREHTAQLIDEFIAQHLKGVRLAETKVAVGHTGRRILDYIDEQDISLVIMGTHGLSGMGRMFFGSVAQRVVQGSRVPVMTVHPVKESSAA